MPLNLPQVARIPPLLGTGLRVLEEVNPELAEELEFDIGDFELMLLEHHIPEVHAIPPRFAYDILDDYLEFGIKGLPSWIEEGIRKRWQFYRYAVDKIISEIMGNKPAEPVNKIIMADPEPHEFVDA